VPGTESSLEIERARAQIKVVYSPLDALREAEQHPERQWCSRVGFETTGRVAWTIKRRGRQTEEFFGSLRAQNMPSMAP